jgi:hypothetical protein
MTPGTMRLPGLRRCLAGAGIQILFTLVAMFILVHWDEQGWLPVAIALSCLAVACTAVVAQGTGLGRFAAGVGRSREWRWLAMASVMVWPAVLMPLVLWLLARNRPRESTSR